MWKNRNVSREWNNNALDGVRILAASSVMLLHYTGYSLYIENVSSPFLQFIRTVAEWIPGVVLFFTMSGFLAAASRDHYTERQFLRRRLVRLLPPIWLCTIVNIAVLLLTAGVKLSSLILWALTQIIGLAWTPPALKGYATGSVNGALWTVFVQLQIYCLIALFWKRLKSLRFFSWLGVIAACICCNLMMNLPALQNLAGGRAESLLSRTAIPYLTWAMVGVLLYRYIDFVIHHAAELFLTSAGIWGVWHIFYFYDPGYYTGAVTGCLLSVMAISLAYLLPGFRLKIDFTYELFLYHWIVLNIWIQYDLMHRLQWQLSLSLFILSAGVVSFTANRIPRYWRWRRHLQETEK